MCRVDDPLTRARNGYPSNARGGLVHGEIGAILEDVSLRFLDLLFHELCPRPGPPVEHIDRPFERIPRLLSGLSLVPSLISIREALDFSETRLEFLNQLLQLLRRRAHIGGWGSGGFKSSKVPLSDDRSNRLKSTLKNAPGASLREEICLEPGEVEVLTFTSLSEETMVANPALCVLLQNLRAANEYLDHYSTR